MDKERLVILKAEVAAQVKEIAGIYDKLEERKRGRGKAAELLKRMSMSIEGVRPPLLPQQSFALLENLRAFRHFFRHAYSYELDERKVRIVFEDALQLKERYKKDINDFLGSF